MILQLENLYKYKGKTYSNLNDPKKSFYINGNVGFYQSLIVFSHDNRPPYLIMILCGGNTRGKGWTFKYKILDINNDAISISGGKYREPLVIKMNDTLTNGLLSITPLGGHKIELSVEIK